MGMMAEATTKLTSTYTTLTAMANLPDWNAAWTGQLTAAPDDIGLATTLLKQSNLSGGMIAGIVAGAVAGLVLSVTAAFSLYRRRKSSKQQTVHWGGHQKSQEKKKKHFFQGRVQVQSANLQVSPSTRSRLPKRRKRMATRQVQQNCLYRHILELQGSDMYRRSRCRLELRQIMCRPRWLGWTSHVNVSMAFCEPGCRRW